MRAPRPGAGLSSDARLSFSPVKAVREQLSQLADHMFEGGWEDDTKRLSRFYCAPVADVGGFSSRYVSALFEARHVFALRRVASTAESALRAASPTHPRTSLAQAQDAGSVQHAG